MQQDPCLPQNCPRSIPNIIIDVGAHTPISDSLNNKKEYIEECANTIAAFTNMSVEILLRTELERIVRIIQYSNS